MTSTDAAQAVFELWQRGETILARRVHQRGDILNETALTPEAPRRRLPVQEQGNRQAESREKGDL